MPTVECTNCGERLEYEEMTVVSGTMLLIGTGRNACFLTHDGHQYPRCPHCGIVMEDYDAQADVRGGPVDP